MLEAGIDPFQVFFEASNNKQSILFHFWGKNIFEYFCETDYILL